jgi:predicted permease
LPMPAYEKTARCVAFYQTVLSGVKALPGVSEAGYTSFMPMANVGGIFPVQLPGETTDDSAFHMASMRFITPGFPQAMGIPLLRGRSVSESDNLQTQLVAVISESLARRYWPNQNPIGRKFEFAHLERTVVGVVGDVRWRGLEGDSEPQVYLPYRQLADNSWTWYAPKDLIVRTSVPPASLVPAIRKIVARADPQQPISDVKTISEVLNEETAPRVLQLEIVATFAAIAILLAGIGIHGVLSFAVSSRTAEIGVRMAMGALPGNILAMVLKQGLALAAGGVLLGAALAYAAGRAMEATLVGI